MGHARDEEQAWSTLAAAVPTGGSGHEPVFVLTPAGRGGHPRARGLRVVGPGRREREYQERIEGLSASLDSARAELDQAALVERGTGRLVDRLEAELERTSAQEALARQQLNRVLVALGASQREVEHLRLALAQGAARALAGATSRAQHPRPATWLARIAARLWR